MAPYFEADHSWIHTGVRELTPKCYVGGRVDGKPTSAMVADDDHLSVYQERESEKTIEKGQVVFDREGSDQKVVFWLSPEDTQRLKDLQPRLSPEEYQYSLVSLWRRILILAGKMKPDEWNVWRHLAKFTSSGHSEDWTQGM